MNLGDVTVKQFGVKIPDKSFKGIVNRWAFFDKTYTIRNLKSDLDNEEFMNNLTEQTKLDNSLVNKFAPKIVEGTKRLKHWVEST